MAMSMIKLRPGVNVEMTKSLNEAGYSESNLGRFRNGLFEKLGGWDAYYPFAVGGVPRALHAWLDLNETEYLGVGSSGTGTILGAISNSSLVTLTPQTLRSDFQEDFDTTNGSPNVTVDDPNIANVTNYDAVEFLTPIAVGGLVLSGLYPIALALGTTTYRIVASSNATSTVVSGGAVPALTTTSGSQVVLVGIVNHGLSVGGKINFPIATTFSGVSILGTYTVQTVPTADTFTISSPTLATASTATSMNGGFAAIRYYIALGPTAVSSGYGIGTYSSGGYSTGSSVAAQAGTAVTATNWTLDNWGEVLIACNEGGGLYYWQPNTGFQNARMIAGNNAPAYNNGAFVSMQTQMLIAYGSTDDLTLGDLGGIGLDQDPLLVKWTNNAGDFTDFEISTTSQAGSRRLSTGSKIVGGMSVAQQELLWTDLGLWSMSYLKSLEAGVWGFNQIGWGCGLIGKHAMARFGSNVVWMGESNFFLLAGSGVQTLPCTVWDTVFQDLNKDYKTKCVAWANTPFNEIFFFFPRASTNATEPDYYVKVNVLSGEWDQGALSRSAAIDQSIVGMPIAASPDGVIYEHEVSPDAAGQAINSYFTTGDAQLAEGNEILFVDWVLPDMKWETADGSSSASIQLTFYAKNYPGDTPTTHGPYTVTSTTQYVNTRIRGRLLSMRVESNDIGSWWRLGGIRYRGAPDGRL